MTERGLGLGISCSNVRNTRPLRTERKTGDLIATSFFFVGLSNNNKTIKYFILRSTSFEAIYSALINIQMKYSKLMLLCTHFNDSDDASQVTIKCCLQYDSVQYINHH